MAENKGDLISREALKNKIQEVVENEIPIDKKWALGLRYALKLIDNAPTVYPICEDKACKYRADERPQGRWIKIFENPFTNGYVCPFCGHRIQVTEQFLPEVTKCESCGADMTGGAV